MSDLKNVVDRIEKLEADKKAVQDDIKEVYQEAKSTGFDVKALRRVVALRRKTAAERESEESIVQTYLGELS